MTDQEITQALDEMLLMFGDLPNPEQEPLRFAYYVKMHKYYKEQGLNANAS